MTVHITIDKKMISTADGATILTAARQNGIEILTFCDFADLTPHGSCRMCLAEVIYADGMRKIVTACDTPVSERMQIYTESAPVKNARKVSADILLSQCPDLPAIRRLADALDVREPSFPLETSANACVQCGACVRACREKSAGVIDFRGKGSSRAVSTADRKHHPACDSCTACIRYCPTGAVTRTLDIGIGAPLAKKFARKLNSRDWFRLFFLSLFIVLMLMTVGGVQIGSFPNHLFSLMDPLQGSMALISGKPGLIAFWPALAVLVLTLLFGKFWCGWICPTGTVLQAFGRRGRRITNRGLRYFKVVHWAFLILMAAFGIMAYFWTDPIAMLMRPFGVVFSGDLAAPLDQPVRLLLRSLIYCGPLLLALALNLIERGFWCRYVCPLGGMLGICARISANKQRVDRDSCIECGDCANICPLGAIENKAPFIADPAECNLCMECGAACPKYAIYFGRRKKTIVTNRFQPGRRDFLRTGVASVTAAAAGLTLYSVFPTRAETSPLFPPGAVRPAETGAETFFKLCSRCGQCVAACPQKILKPSLGDQDWTTAAMPEVDLSNASCRPDCTRCSQNCPTGAIPPFTFEEKITMKIGTAHVEPAACIQCYRCVSSCPYQAFEQNPDPETGSIYPQVNPDRCNGCGICLQVCPARQQGAITVKSVLNEQ